MSQGRFDVVTLPTILVGWAATIAASIGGWRIAMSHDRVIESADSLLAAALIFLFAWNIMIAAMMLPSSLGTIDWFRGLDGVAHAPHRLTAAFLAGYAAIWTVVGAGALAGDTIIHDLTHRWSWLGSRPWLIAGSALFVAGGFQLTAWSRHCRSSEPRHVNVTPAGAVSTANATRLGAEHGIIRLHECWPLMLLSFAFGMTSLAWMAGLTLLMVAERSARLAAGTALASGAVFLIGAVLILLIPGSLPPSVLPT